MGFGNTKKRWLVIVSIIVTFACLLTALINFSSNSAPTAGEGYLLSSTHVRENTAPGKIVFEKSGVGLDASNLSEGYFCIYQDASSEAEIQKKLIVQVAYISGSSDTADDTDLGGLESLIYDYTLHAGKLFEAIPLQSGSGKYSVKVMEEVKSDSNRYLPVFVTELDVNLENDFVCFLYPNQMVYFNKKSPLVEISSVISRGMNTDVQKVKAIYSWIIANIEFNSDSGSAELSDLSGPSDSVAVLSSLSGDYWDMATLMAVLCRIQGIPAKLVYGHRSSNDDLDHTSYPHAWTEIYIKGEGWVTVGIFENNKTWGQADTKNSSTIKQKYRYTALRYY